MSDDEELELVSDSLEMIHQHVEQLAHISKSLYTRALRVHQLTENPALDLWTETFKIHARAASWAKRNMVSSKCSLWQIHETLLQCAKKEKRVFYGNIVSLSDEEAAIMDLPANQPISVWLMLGRLPRFFL